MKMAAAAGNGDEQDRIEGSTAHDPADGDDSFSFESLIFPVLLRMQLSTEPPSSEGAMDGVQRLSRQHDNRKDNYGRNCNPHFMFRRGNVSGSASMCEGPHAGDPRRARYQRRRGNGRTPRRRHVKLPRLARPKGCFDTSAEWS